MTFDMKPSPQFLFARAVIARLADVPALRYRAPGEPQPRCVVYPRPFVSADQAESLDIAAAQYGVAILVSPAGVAAPENPEHARAGVLEVSAAVYVLATRNASLAETSEEPCEAGELAAAYADAVAAALISWEPRADLSAIERPRVADIQEIDMAASREFPNHENLIGAALRLTQKIHYKRYYDT